jgi:polyribonucleotide nucleotidyltransferase
MSFIQVPKTPVFYKHLQTDIPYSYMKFVIGKKGQYLKQCCTKAGVNGIWFNKEKHILEIWGPNEKLTDAINLLEEKINLVRKQVPMNEIMTNIQELPHDICVSGSLDNLITEEKIKFVIGKNGKNFKRITKNANVSFIWYNKDTNCIDIWGNELHINDAVNMIFDDIYKVNSTHISINDEEMELC